jgi:hypothetical protein
MFDRSDQHHSAAKDNVEVLELFQIVLPLDDSSFREAAFEMALESSLRQRRPLSMVDCLIRLLLEDGTTQISYLVTFNERDFADVCRRRGVEII